MGGGGEGAIRCLKGVISEKGDEGGEGGERRMREEKRRKGIERFFTAKSFAYYFLKLQLRHFQSKKS